MAEIQDALDQIYAIQGGLTISSPVEARIEHVWPFFPGESRVVTKTPAFINSWSAPTVEYKPSLMTLSYTVNMQLLVQDARSEQSARIATAFYPKIVAAFAANVRLGLSDWTVRRLIGGDPTLGLLGPESDQAGKSFIGLDLVLELYQTKGFEILAGDPP